MTKNYKLNFRYYKNLGYNLVKDLLPQKNLRFVALVALIFAIISLLLGLLVGKEQNIGEEETTQQIIKLSQNIRRQYRTRPDFWGLSSQEVIKNKLYPLDMSVKNGKLIGYFDNIVEVGADENGVQVMPTIKKFVIAYKNLSKKQCVALGSAKFNKEFWLGVSAMKIANKQNSQIFDWSKNELALPTNKKTIKNLCNSINDVVFYLE